jgi:hypothetical protein
MRKLETTFVKNQLTYELINRHEKCGLFKLWLIEDYLPAPCHCGWEVCRIFQNEERIIAGHTVVAGESITGNDSFGADGSKAFFPHDKNDAIAYLEEFKLELELKEADKSLNLLRG